MTNPPLLLPEDEKIVDALVEKFRRDLDLIASFETQLRTLSEDGQLRRLIHSHRSRVKDPEHLRDKLRRKLLKSREAGTVFDITVDSLYERVNDLAGLRLLHLHTAQFAQINTRLLELFDEHRFTVLEGPQARVWDDEYREVFKAMGVSTVSSDRMYTSVHYVVLPNRKSRITGEIQVRTLAEELWGEVDHSINYPQSSDVLACREQLRVLARVTSSCTRLVDAIYRTRDEAIATPRVAAG